MFFGVSFGLGRGLGSGLGLVLVGFWSFEFGYIYFFGL